MLNDGFQPWFSDRAKFGLRSLGAFEGKCTEEGLAAINTVLRGRVKLLWGAAFAYCEFKFVLSLQFFLIIDLKSEMYPLSYCHTRGHQNMSLT